MIVDNECIISADATGFDLESVRPGPGKPIRIAIVNDEVVAGTLTGAIGAGAVAVTHGATQALAEGGLTALVTATSVVGEGVIFDLPSTALRWIAITTLPANAAAAVLLDGDQTNL